MDNWNYWLLGVMLLAAAVDDIATGKVRNAITLPAILAGLIGHLIWPEQLGIADAAIGMLAGFGAMYIAWKLGAIGGGDVKLMAAVGAITGWKFALTAMFFGLAVAVVMAIAMLIWKRSLRDTLKRLGLFAFLTAARAKPAVPITSKSMRLPFGTALCVGCGIVLVIVLSGMNCRLIWF